MPQTCQSNATQPKDKWNLPAPIINSMDRSTHHNLSFPSSVCLPNLPKTSPSAGSCRDLKGHLVTRRSCPRLVNQLTCIHKANETCQNQVSAPWTEADTTMYYFCPVRFSKSSQTQPICWVSWVLKGMHPGMQLMSQACQLNTTHPEGKRYVPAAIISNLVRIHLDSAMVSFRVGPFQCSLKFSLWHGSTGRQCTDMPKEALISLRMHQ